MNIITQNEKIDRITDGINTILQLPENEYKYFISRLQPAHVIEQIHLYYTTDECEMPSYPIQVGLEKTHAENSAYIGRAYYGAPSFSTHTILETCKKMQDSFEKNSPEYSRLEEIIHTRDLESFKAFYSKEYSVDIELLNKTFAILSDNELLRNFMDYTNHEETFALKGKKTPIKEYLMCLGNIFGDKDSDGALSNDIPIASHFLIQNLDTYMQNYSQIYDSINLDRFVNPYYTFLRTKKLSDNIVRDEQEPDWNLSPEIQHEILDNMPQDLSLEEQALYIYCKMCQTFLYDEGYLYRNKLQKENYEATFSKDHLESIKVGSKITCYDFSRIYVKFINSLDGDITAVMVLEGANEGHAYAGFYTDKISATVEAINVNSDKDITNDLMKAKNGINLRGITAISDKSNIIPDALNKVYSQILGKQPHSIKEYIQELQSIPIEPEAQTNIPLKIRALLETMKTNNIYGNEFTQSFWGISKTKYFGEEKLEKAYLGELQTDENGISRYKRHILVRTPNSSNQENKPYEVYLIDTDTLQFTPCSNMQVIEMLNSGRLIYESDAHKLPGIDKEVV